MPQVSLDSLAAHRQSAKRSPHLRASHAHQDPQDHRDHPDSQATLDAQASQADQATMDSQDNQDHRDPLARQDNQAATADQEIQVAQPTALQTSLANPEKTDSQVSLDSQETQDRTEDQDNPETQDPRDHQDSQDLLESPEGTETQESRAPLVHQERKVSAPSTVPSMVVCSSRMEPGDKRFFGPSPSHIFHFNISPSNGYFVFFLVLLLDCRAFCIQ